MLYFIMYYLISNNIQRSSIGVISDKSYDEIPAILLSNSSVNTSSLKLNPRIPLLRNCNLCPTILHDDLDFLHIWKPKYPTDTRGHSVSDFN